MLAGGSARDNVGLGAQVLDTEPNRAEAAARGWLERLGLSGHENDYPHALSGGMRQRVSIARAIITQPEVILYDSPTGGLDPITSTTIVELIVKQRDVYKTSSLLVTHRLQDAITMATSYFDVKANAMKPLAPGSTTDVKTSFVILKDGKIIFDGDAAELTATKDEYIKEYIA